MMGFMQSEWSVTVVIDLFAGGTGAGILVLSVLLWIFSKERYRKTAACGAWISFGCIVVGLICLLADVGQPFRAMILPVSFSHFSSWMTLGAWFMFAALVCSLVFALSITARFTRFLGRKWKSFPKARPWFAYIAGILGVLAGFMVTVYTGFLISSGTGIPFWNTFLLPIGFSSSAFYGALCVMIALLLYERRKVLAGSAEEPAAEGEGTSAPKNSTNFALFPTRLFGGIAILCALGFSAVIAIHLSLASSGALVEGAVLASARAAETAQTSAQSILSGDFCVLLWLGVAGIGIAVPLILLIVNEVMKMSKRHCFVIAVIVAICALVALFSWRYMVLAVGIHQPLSSVDAAQIAEGSTFVLR